MSRYIKRVPLDFKFPINSNRSYAEEHADEHERKCRRKGDHDETCGYHYNETPKGEGWQLWQGVSDTPITPVFRTAEELIAYMSQPVPFGDRPHYDPSPYPTTPWDKGWRRNVAEAFVREEGWCPSGVFFAGGEVNPAEACGFGTSVD